jgi:intein/homing endonuclease
MKDVPKYVPNRHFFEQSSEVIDFWLKEKEKLTYGLTLDGYFIHPWLYYHMNFFKTPIPTINDRGTKVEVPKVPALTDNTFMFIETYQEAEERGMGMCAFGSRGVFKSTHLASVSSWLAMAKPYGVVSITGGNKEDLHNISRLLGVTFNKMHPALQMNRLISDWTEKVEFGWMENSQEKFVQSIISVTNEAGGAKSKSEKGAGPSPVGYIKDEIGKYDFLESYGAALESFYTADGMKLVPILSGCVCKDSLVWNNKGDLIKIQDLIQSEGILGFNQEEGKFSKEHISYWQPPHEKKCYRITLKSGKTLECSDDHPILYRPRLETETVNGKRRRKVYFIEAEKLKVGNHVAVIDSVDLWSDEEMWQPRLVGQLVGDGNYSVDHTPTLSNCDHEIVNYVLDNFETTLKDEYLTKDGKEYKEIRIKGICKELRKLGIYGQTKKNKRLPEKLHSFSKKSVCSFIGGYFDTDGYLSTTGKNKMIKIGSISEYMMKDLQIILQKLGIHGYINKVISKPSKLVNVESTGYVLTIADKKSVLAFYENIKFSVKYKQDLLEECVKKFQGCKEKIDKNWIGMRFETVSKIEYIGMQPVYNLTADTTNTYIANGIITHNTSGNEKLSADAKKLLSNPESYGIITMNWDRLERGVDPDDITWNSYKKKPFGTFMPGQMTGRYGAPKVESNLARYLGLDEGVSDLKNILINVTDWKASKAKIQARIDEKKDKSEKDRLKMYYPMTPEDCFLTKGKNPFPVNIIRRHKEKLIESGNIGRDIELIKEGSSVKEVSTEKQRIKFPHDGTEHDAPLVVFGKVPQAPPPAYQNVAGLDDYKLDIAKTSDSAGSLYVIKRRFQDANSPAETIVCCLNTRPGRHEDFYKDIEDVLETWNAQCLIEAVDVGIVQHLRLRGKVDVLLYPELSYAPSADNRNRFKSGKYGMYPHTYNVKYRMDKVVDAMKEEYTIGFEEDGRPIIKYGVEFIDDIELLTEMEEYYPGGNFDKLTAFSHAIVLARQLDDDNVRPVDEASQKQEYLRQMQMSQQNAGNRRVNPYAGRRVNPYR